MPQSTHGLTIFLPILRSYHKKSFLHEAHTALFAGGFTLHLLADLDVDLEKLGDTAVQADRFTLVQVAFTVLGRNALLDARLGQAEIASGRRQLKSS